MYRQLMATWRAEGFDAVLTPSNVMPACRQGTCSDLTLCCWPTFLYNLFNMPAGILPVTTVTVSRARMVKDWDCALSNHFTCSGWTSRKTTKSCARTRSAMALTGS